VCVLQSELCVCVRARAASCACACCCSVLQCVAVCYGVLQRVAVEAVCGRAYA